MKICDVMQKGNWLILVLDSEWDAFLFADDFKAGEYELKRKNPKRSLDANAYCWVLIHKIAEKIRDVPAEVYRRYVRDVGQKTIVTCVQEEDTETEVRTFLDRHIGRSVDVGGCRAASRCTSTTAAATTTAGKWPRSST